MLAAQLKTLASLKPSKPTLSTLCMWVLLLQSCLFLTLWTVTLQDSLPMEFPRQEYWSGLPCAPPGDLPDPGIQTPPFMSPALIGRLLTISTTFLLQPLLILNFFGICYPNTILSFETYTKWAWIPHPIFGDKSHLPTQGLMFHSHILFWFPAITKILCDVIKKK